MNPPGEDIVLGPDSVETGDLLGNCWRVSGSGPPTRKSYLCVHEDELC